MTEQHGLMAVIGLFGLTWVIGGWLQWLTLRRQERLIRDLEQHREALNRIKSAEAIDPWLGNPGPLDPGRAEDHRDVALVRSRSWKEF